MLMTDDPTPNVAVQATWMNRYTPSFGETFGAGAATQFEETSLGILGRFDTLSTASGKGPAIQPTPDEWERSPYYRDGLVPTPGMTWAQAEVLADRYDRKQRRDFVMERGSTIAGVLGSIAAAIPDPLNFIPVFGWMGKIKALAPLGRIGTRALVGAGENAAITAALQVPQAALAKEYQEEWDWKSAAQNIAIATGLGAGFGALGGWVERIGEKRRASATAKVISDLIDERTPDVSPVAPSKVNALDSLPAVRGLMSERNPELAKAADAVLGLRDTATRLLDAVGREGAEPSPFPAVQEIADRFRAEGNQVRRTVDGMAALPEERKAQVLSDAMTDLRSKYVPEMTEALRAQTAPDVQTPEAIIAEARKGITESPERIAAQAAELDKQIAQVDAKIADAEKANQPAGDLRRDKTRLTQARDDLKAHADYMGKLDTATREAVQPDMTVPHVEESPLVREVPSIKPEEMGLPDDTEIPMLDAKFNDLKEAGQLPASTNDLLDSASQLGERLNKMAKAVERGILCLTRPG